MLDSLKNVHKKFVNKMKCHLIDEEVGLIGMSWDRLHSSSNREVAFHSAYTFLCIFLVSLIY